MTDATTEQRLEQIERGLDALFATEVAREVFEAVDFEALLADEPAEDPIDADRLAEVIGRPVGRVLVRQLVGGSGASGVAKRTVGTEVGGRVAAEALRVAFETLDAETVAARLGDLDEATPGPAVTEDLAPVAGAGAGTAASGASSDDEAVEIDVQAASDGDGESSLGGVDADAAGGEDAAGDDGSGAGSGAGDAADDGSADGGSADDGSGTDGGGDAGSGEGSG